MLAVREESRGGAQEPKPFVPRSGFPTSHSHVAPTVTRFIFDQAASYLHYTIKTSWPQEDIAKYEALQKSEREINESLSKFQETVEEKDFEQHREVVTKTLEAEEIHIVESQGGTPSEEYKKLIDESRVTRPDQVTAFKLKTEQLLYLWFKKVVDNLAARHTGSCAVGVLALVFTLGWIGRDLEAAESKMPALDMENKEQLDLLKENIQQAFEYHVKGQRLQEHLALRNATNGIIRHIKFLKSQQATAIAQKRCSLMLGAFSAYFAVTTLWSGAIAWKHLSGTQKAICTVAVGTTGSSTLINGIYCARFAKMLDRLEELVEDVLRIQRNMLTSDF